MTIPIFQITVTGGHVLGRCYNRTTYELVSNQKMSEADWAYCRERFFGCGQSWGFKARDDEKEINIGGQYRWVYNVWVDCDSSD